MIFEKIREKIEKLSLQQKMKSASIFCEDDYIKSTQKQYVKQSCDMQAFAYDKALDIINQVEDEYNNGWIKCEGKTFAVGCKYLIVDKDNDIYIATYLNDNVFIARDKNYFMPIRLEATYCQLLPLPPKPPKGE